MVKKFLLSSVVLALASMLWIPKYNNNVCITFDDYYSNRDANKNCYYNPDVGLTVPEIAQRNGYPVETYEVSTADGYVLTVFRIPHGKRYKYAKRGKPVFLQHGAHENSGCFVNIGNKSLAFILADEGYDVWLGNARGSKYSLNHLNLNHTIDSEFWDFSIDEYGNYDLPAEINLVHSLTNQKMVYIGFSLGTTMMYVYTSLYPETAYDKVELFINLAPAVFVGEDNNLAKVVSPFWAYLERILKLISIGEVFSAHLVPTEVLRFVCLPFPFQMKFCLIPQMLVMGLNYSNTDPETLPITLIHNSDQTSIKTWAHMAQLWYKQTFDQFDYGQEENLKRYGTKTSPDYNLTNVKVPLYFIRAQSDLLITEKDVNKLYDALPEYNKPKGIYVVKYGYGHLDLLLAKDVVPLVYDHIIQVVNSLN